MAKANDTACDRTNHENTKYIHTYSELISLMSGQYWGDASGFATRYDGPTLQTMKGFIDLESKRLCTDLQEYLRTWDESEQLCAQDESSALTMVISTRRTVDQIREFLGFSDVLAMAIDERGQRSDPLAAVDDAEIQEADIQKLEDISCMIGEAGVALRCAHILYNQDCEADEKHEGIEALGMISKSLLVDQDRFDSNAGAMADIAQYLSFVSKEVLGLKLTVEYLLNVVDTLGTKDDSQALGWVAFRLLNMALDTLTTFEERYKSHSEARGECNV